MMLPLRLRLGLLFTAGFGILLCGAGVALHQWLVRGYQAEFNRSLHASADGFQALHEQEMETFGDPWAAAEHALGELLYPDRFFMARREGSEPLVSRGLGQSTPPEAFLRRTGEGGPWDVTVAGTPYRVVRRSLGPGVDGYVVHLRAPLDRRVDTLTAALWVGLPLVLLLGGVLGAVGSRSALRPVVGVAHSARGVARKVAGGADHFDRLDERGGNDEVAVLTAAFNELVDRLGPALRRERALVENQRAFLATAAHEMRMPLTILRSEAEVALEGDSGGSDRLRGALQRVVEECDGMGELVSDLLLLARADSASPELHPRRVFLDDLASQVLHRLRAHPEARGRALRLGDFESAPAVVDATLVERALTVLLHNALVHASPSAIEVAAGCDEAGSWVCVRDWGPGIPEHARDEVFGRFVRLDPRVPGTGLGLPIAAWIAETHGGTLKLDAPPGGGARFILRVPAAPVGGEVSPPPPPSRRPRSASR